MNLYMEAEVPIGDLARRTGVSVSTIRAWERRYGFPIPRRLAGGHRRYTERDVAAVLNALSERQAGSSIARAVERAKAASLGPRTSIFGALRHELSDVAPVVLSKGGMLALSRAIEDEIAGRADQALLIGAFQHERFWRASEPRWRNLAVTARASIVMATLPRRRRRGQLWEVPVDATTPIAREWVVVCDSPAFSVCLAGVELPGAGARSFECLWTTEPIVVRDIARLAADIAIATEPRLRGVVDVALETPVVARYNSLRTATSLANRVIAYIDRR